MNEHDDAIVAVEDRNASYLSIVVILGWFIIQWQLSVLMQSFFQHRYGAHRQFTMSKRWERFFHLLAWVIQGPSYLHPPTYAIMHRMHHAYSDTPNDPHSPFQQKNFATMMWRTRTLFDDLRYRRVAVEARFEGGFPEWHFLDETVGGWTTPVAWGVLYTGLYIVLATHWWLFVLLPIHLVLGPTHGAIVNYFGHKVGYHNYDNDDHSRNTLIVDVLTMGELFQNNHHKWAQSPNFAIRWFELDLGYQFVRLLGWLRIIDLSRAQVPHWRAHAEPVSRPS